MGLQIRDWGLRLGIKITIFDFGDCAFGTRIEDWDWRLGLRFGIAIKIEISDWDCMLG